MLRYCYLFHTNTTQCTLANINYPGMHMTQIATIYSIFGYGDK